MNSRDAKKMEEVVCRLTTDNSLVNTQNFSKCSLETQLILIFKTNIWKIRF